MAARNALCMFNTHGICRMTIGALSGLLKPRDVVGRETFFGTSRERRATSPR